MKTIKKTLEHPVAFCKSIHFLPVFCVLMGVIAVLLPWNPPQAFSASCYWRVGTGDWSTASNWNSAVPSSSDDAYIQNGGAANITQAGQQAANLYLGGSGGSGTIDMTNGGLSVSYEDIGDSGTGTFNQSKGTHNVTYLTINSQGSYTYSGGTLNINGGLTNLGTLDLASSTVTLNASSIILDFSSGTLSNTQNASLNVDSHSMVIIPNGKTSTFIHSFAHYANAGILHEAGTTLNIDTSQSIYGIGNIANHVNCNGTLSAPNGMIFNLNGGLNAGPNSVVNISGGTLYVNDSGSGMSGGSVTTLLDSVGDSGTGRVYANGRNAHYPQHPFSRHECRLQWYIQSQRGSLGGRSEYRICWLLWDGYIHANWWNSHVP